MKQNIEDTDIPQQIIIFFGADGTGKSTQANLLYNYKSPKIPVLKIWIRARHTIAFILSNFFIRLGYFRVIKVPSGVYYNIFDPKILPGISKFWVFLEFISIIPVVLVKFLIPKVLGYTIIAERYLIDTIVYLQYWMDNDFKDSLWFRILLALLPYNAYYFYFHADLNDILDRLKYDTSDIDFLKHQIKSYQVFAKLFRAHVINTSILTKEESHVKIINILNSCQT